MTLLRLAARACRRGRTRQRKSPSGRPRSRLASGRDRRASCRPGENAGAPSAAGLFFVRLSHSVEVLVDGYAAEVVIRAPRLVLRRHGGEDRYLPSGLKVKSSPTQNVVEVG